MDEMFSGLTSLTELSLPKFNTKNLDTCFNIWDGITKLDLHIHEELCEKILRNKPEGINVTNITDNENI
jgi:surface protein